MNQSAVFDIYGHLAFENCTFKGIYDLDTEFTLHLCRSKDDFKQIESSPTELKKVLKMIQCKTYNVYIYFNIMEFVVNIEIMMSDSKVTMAKFNIGNETTYTQGVTTQSVTFVNVTIVGCKFQYCPIEIEAFTPKSVALIQVLDTIMSYSYILEYKSHFCSFGYIIDNCTFTNINVYSLKSFAHYIRITNNKFIIEEKGS